MSIPVDPNQERHKYYSTIRGEPWRSYFATITSSHRKNIIQKGDYPLIAGILAVIDLQSCLRTRLFCRGWKPLPPIKLKFKPIDKYAILVKTKGYKIDGFEDWCAIKIQSLFRGWKSRRSTYFLKSNIYKVAVKMIEKCYLLHHIKLTSSDGNLFVFAARKIWRFWIYFRNRRLYNYLKGLINFCNAGDPYVLLRSINPAESGLIDPAAGLLLRFRLGGYRFPPQIYYKIYTKAPVCDIGSFAPKNYTRSIPIPEQKIEGYKNKPCETTIRVGGSLYHAFISARTTQEIEKIGTDDWYRRYENNGWRTIENDILDPHNPITVDSNRRKKDFHYNPVVRRQNKQQLLKERKRKWYKTMYEQGMMKSESKQQEQKEDTRKSNINSSTSKDLPEINFDDPNWEEQCNDLLEWCNGLDYDEYVNQWTKIATTNTNPSESDF